MKTTNRHILRWQIAIQEYRGNMAIIYKEVKSDNNADGLSRWPLDNVKRNPAYGPEVAANIPIHFMEIDRRKNFKFSEWAPESGTPDSGDTDSEGTETPTLGISSSQLNDEFFSAVTKTYVKHKQCGILLQLLQQKYRTPELESQLEEPWLRDYKDNKFFLTDGLLYHREKHTSALTVVDKDHISLIRQECHDCSYMGHMSEDKTKERVESTAWWPKWEQELSEYMSHQQIITPSNGCCSNSSLNPAYCQLAISFPHWPILRVTNPQAIILIFGPGGGLFSLLGPMAPLATMRAFRPTPYIMGVLA
ncbi:hypothetical protein O181_054772 [Austropuccinia psidii MF-1]|uniref:Integrase zinc-binding domain-containing protein n=1 Tax=Austropuccinia psidii MF-1 TaxID=1389203 RepID=A0A9Q3ECB3_9BASI|nr:hypothetical protein [Austropuccinia psidii MF-1]